MKSRTFISTMALLPFLACFTAWADDAVILMKTGDACDERLQNRQALDAYLAAAKLGPPNAELLRRIAKEYGELMADTDSADQKRELGETAVEYAKQAIAADPRNAMAELSMAVCYGRVAPLLDNKTKIAYSRLVKEVRGRRRWRWTPNNDLTYNVLGSWNYEAGWAEPISPRTCGDDLRAVARCVVPGIGELF